MTDRQSQTGLTTTQKTGFVLLLIFGILTIGLAGLQLRNNIYGPFAEKMARARDIEPNQLDEQARLQMLDTDKDGLTDWEEINFYSTSPYLPDTDSDGLTDKTEIDNGTNPLCPEGQTCNADETTLSATSTETNTVASPLLGEATGFEQMVGVSSSQNIDFSSLGVMLGDKQKLRQLLLETGSISAEQLSKIDDKTLESLINEILIQQLNSTDTTNTAGLNNIVKQ
jgi:hypothetical protein